MLEDRVLLFSDLHIGRKGESDIEYDVVIQYSNWIKEEALKNNISTLLFLGDFFHDREEISLTELNLADKFLENLSDFNIIMIVGNHDCYYKDHAEVHSLSIFNKWKNIIVVDKLEVFEYMGKTVAFMPWGFSFNDVPAGVDYGFGHMEIQTFRYNKIKVCEHGMTSSDILGKINKVFSGHFHIRSKKTYDCGSIAYIGNTFEQNWSDYEEEKGVEIFTFSTGETQFIKNTVSPKHIKIHLSKLISKDEKESQILKNDLKNNIVKLIIDDEIEPEKLSVLSDKLSKLSPIKFDTESVINSELKSADDFDSVEIDMGLLLTEYIEKLEISENKDKILEETLNLYTKSLSQVKTDDE